MIAPQEIFIEGMTNLEVRNIIRDFSGYIKFAERHITDEFGESFTQELYKRGFLEKCDAKVHRVLGTSLVTKDGDTVVCISNVGKSFARAKCRPVKRETATKLIEGLKKRLAEVNENKNFLYGVEVAVLFGSYVNSDKALLGDIDIAIRLGRKPWVTTKDLQEQQKESNSDYWLEVLGYPRTKVRRFLKNRSSALQFNDLDGQEDAVFKDAHVFLVGQK